MKEENEVKKYIQFYKTLLGKKILEYEIKLVDKKIIRSKKVLSIGCGPAILEARLHLLHPDMNIVALDSSKLMIKKASKELSIVYGDAQHLGFKNSSFDAVLYITSLEFIQSLQKAIKETYRVLQSQGLLLVLMLNPSSNYFKQKYNNNNSYIRKYIKHTNINKIEKIISQYFNIKNKIYFLGITEQDIIDTNKKNISSLYVLESEKL